MGKWPTSVDCAGCGQRLMIGQRAVRFLTQIAGVCVCTEECEGKYRDAAKLIAFLRGNDAIQVDDGRVLRWDLWRKGRYRWDHRHKRLELVNDDKK